MTTVRSHLGLLLSKDLTELGMQVAHSMPGRWCWLSAVSTARLLLGVCIHGLSSLTVLGLNFLYGSSELQKRDSQLARGSCIIFWV